MTRLSTGSEQRATLSGVAQGAVGDGGTTPSASDIYTMMHRRIVLIVVLFIVLSAVAVGGFWAWWNYLPGYRAECLIACISNIPEAELTIEQERLRQEDHERFVMTQALALKSPSILEEALKVADVRETHWFKSVQRREDHPLLELTDELRVSPVRGTNYLRAWMECHHRADPAIIVNTVVDRWYEAVKRRSAQEFASEPLKDAQEELSTVDSEIEAKRARLSDMAMRLPAGARQNPGNNISNQQVEQYAAQVAQLTLELSQLEQFRQIYNDPEGIPVTAEDRALVEQDPQVAELSRTLFLLEQQRAADENVFGQEHRERRRIDARIAATEEELARLRAEKLQERREDIREATNTAYANTQHALFLAKENLARAEAMLQDQDQLLFNYTNLEAEIAQDVEYQLQLTEYIKSLNRVVRQRAAVNINVEQPATEPLEQSSPSLFVLPIGIFLALVFSIGIALGLEMLDKSVRTPQDVTRHLSMAMLGTVPHTDDEEVAIGQVETAVRDASRSMVAEAFRRVSTNMRFSAPADRQRSVLITSPLPDDGKTTVACNLALAVAQGGQRVLLIDANFRRPGIHRIFQQIGEQGLSNILVGDGTLESSAVHTDMPTLDLLGGGPVPPNPVALLGSDSLRKLLEEAAARYDQVIIDTAPVLLASDALVLAPEVDGVVLVVRARANTRGAARRARNLLVDLNAQLFGAVLNAAQVTRGGYFRQQLRAYYDYQVDAKTGGSPPAPQPTAKSG